MNAPKLIIGQRVKTAYKHANTGTVLDVDENHLAPDHNRHARIQWDRTDVPVQWVRFTSVEAI